MSEQSHDDFLASGPMPPHRIHDLVHQYLESAAAGKEATRPYTEGAEGEPLPDLALTLMCAMKAVTEKMIAHMWSIYLDYVMREQSREDSYLSDLLVRRAENADEGLASLLEALKVKLHAENHKLSVEVLEAQVAELGDRVATLQGSVEAVEQQRDSALRVLLRLRELASDGPVSPEDIVNATQHQPLWAVAEEDEDESEG